MKAIATFDVGTTNVKGVLISFDGKVLHTQSRKVDTIYLGEKKNLIEQQPEQWYQAFCDISNSFFDVCAPEEIAGLVLSGQMQDLILLNHQGKPVMDAVLYSDGRAWKEAEEISRIIGKQRIEESTANDFDGSRPFAKLLWVKQNRPLVYQQTAHVLISSKDYIITRLTDQYVSDVISCSTAGLMDIRTKQWHAEWLVEIGLQEVQWPRILHAHQQAGQVTPAAARETGYVSGMPVYAGAGDAGSATLSSGISRDGEFNINLGTSGWIACTSQHPLLQEGVSNLAAMPEDTYINVVPFFNAGNVYQWAAGFFFPDIPQEHRYDCLEKLLGESKPGSGGALFLPYLLGERFPVMDAEIAGGFVDVRPATTRADMARACLEGVAYSIRQGLDSIGKAPTRMTLVGGGAKSQTWCQILADMLNMPIVVFRDAEYLPSMAIASSVLLAQGFIPDYESFIHGITTGQDGKVIEPDSAAAAMYHRYYPRFCSIYPALAGLSPAIDE